MPPSLVRLSLFVVASHLLSCNQTHDQSTSNPESVQSGANYNRNYCDDVAPGSCFTLVLKIPKPTMINDVGLSMLALAEESAMLNPFIKDACMAGLRQFWVENAQPRFPPRPLRHDFALKVKKMRCVIFPMDKFADEEANIDLHPNELALTVRLTKFEIEAKNSHLSANMLKLDQKKSKISTSYRSVMLSTGSAVGTTPYGGLFLNRIGEDPRPVSASFGRDISVKINLAALRKNVENLTAKPATETTAAAYAFITNAATSIMSADPVTGSLMIAGMGFNFFKSMCGYENGGERDKSLCDYAAESGIKTSEIAANIAIPSSENSELLRSAILNSTSALLNHILKQGDGRQLRDVYKL